MGILLGLKKLVELISLLSTLLEIIPKLIGAIKKVFALLRKRKEKPEDKQETSNEDTQQK